MFAPESNAMEKQVKTVETPWEAIIICVSASGQDSSHLDPVQSQILSTMSRVSEGLNLVGWRGRVLKFRGWKSYEQVFKRVRD